MQRNGWLVFLITGILITVQAAQNIGFIPLRLPADHWEWLTIDPDVIDYFRFNFRQQGLWQLLEALLLIPLACIPYRRGARWAWQALWLLPVQMGVMAALFPWLLPFWILLIGAQSWALLAARPILWAEEWAVERPTVRRGWWVPAVLGTLFLLFSWYNAAFIPTINPADPDLGWGWLTADPEVIDYIKFYFRVEGVWQIPVGLLTIILAALPYRRGASWAWWVLAYLPLHLLWLLLLMPWVLPVVATPLAVLVIVLLWERPVAVTTVAQFENRGDGS